MDKIRLDKALLNQISSRAKAQDMIKDGKISVNGRVITKASFLVGDEDDIVICFFIGYIVVWYFIGLWGYRYHNIC